jgi:hypothetical protein
VCRSTCGRSGSIHTKRIAAPHSGQVGRSNNSGTEIAGNAAIKVHQEKLIVKSIKDQNCDCAMTVFPRLSSKKLFA